MPGHDAAVLHHVIEGAGAPLVLIHGVGASLSSWDGVAARLVPHFRILRMDLRGHGGSPPIREPWSLERFAADIVATMDDAGFRRAHLAGFSLGGLIGQCLALDWPDRFDKVALISAVTGRTQEERARVTDRLAIIREKGIAAVAGAARDRWFTDAFAAAHPERIEARLAELTACDIESYIEAYRVFGQSELAHRLHGIGHETLVMTGENDSGSSPRMSCLMHESIANSRLVILPGLKHSVLVEAPDVIAGHLLEFLGEQAGGIS